MSDDTSRKELRLVISEHISTFPDPLTLEPGEEVQVGQADDEWPAFLWCVNAQGKGGWVPETFLQRDGDTATALRAYDARELSVKAGDTVVVGERAGGWAWVTDAASESGWIPEKCLGNRVERRRPR